MTNLEKEKQRINEMSAEEFIDQYYRCYTCDYCIERDTVCELSCKEGIRRYFEKEAE